MYKSLLAATFGILFAGGSALAQNGGGHGGGGGGGRGGGGAVRGGYYGGGYGGGYGRGGYGRGYGGYGYGGFGFFPFYGGYGYGLGGLGYGGYGGYGGDYYPYTGGSTYYPAYDSTSVVAPYATSGSALVPYSSVYPPAGSSEGPLTIAPADSASNIAPPASPPATLPPTLAASTATIAVVVPMGGHVWFNGSMNPPSDNGSKWKFTTQKLDPGKTYVLEIKATWNDGVSDHSYNVPLRVQAGDNMTVDMTRIQ
jgi:uncharacterized protein (TIGR03000 family)